MNFDISDVPDYANAPSWEGDVWHCLNQKKAPPLPVWEHIFWPGVSREYVERLARDPVVGFALPAEKYIQFLRYANGANLFFGSLQLLVEGLSMRMSR